MQSVLIARGAIYAYAERTSIVLIALPMLGSCREIPLGVRLASVLVLSRPRPFVGLSQHFFSVDLAGKGDGPSRVAGWMCI